MTALRLIVLLAATVWVSSAPASERLESKNLSDFILSWVETHSILDFNPRPGGWGPTALTRKGTSALEWVKRSLAQNGLDRDSPNPFVVEGFGTQVLQLDAFPGSVMRLHLAVTGPDWDSGGGHLSSVWIQRIESEGAERELYLESLEMVPGSPSFSAALIRQQLDFVDRVWGETGRLKLYATKVGAYQWAKLGFDFFDPSMAEDFRKQLAEFLRNRGIPFDPKTIERLRTPRDFAEFSEGPAQVITRYGDTRKVTVPIGKAFMIGRPWEGVIQGNSSRACLRDHLQP